MIFKILLLLCFFRLSVSAEVFEGGYFKAEIPDNFKAAVSVSGEKGPIGVFFRAPEPNVYFYIFAPKKTSESAEIVKKEGEEVIEERSENKNGAVHRWLTYKGSGGITRTFHEIRDSDRDRILITGFQFPSYKKYKKYKKKYFLFKKSIRHFDE